MSAKCPSKTYELAMGKCPTNNCKAFSHRSVESYGDWLPLKSLNALLIRCLILMQHKTREKKQRMLLHHIVILCGTKFKLSDKFYNEPYLNITQKRRY